MQTIRVIAAVILRGDRYLLGRRRLGKRHGGHWEFPGGKVLAGESTFDTASRELAEELSLTVRAVGVKLYSSRDEDSPFVIDFVEVAATGEPLLHEHEEVGWFSVSEMSEMTLAPADARFVRRLQPSG